MNALSSIPCACRKMLMTSKMFDAVATVLGPDVPLADDTGTGEGEETEDPPLRTGQEEAEDSLAVLQM